MRPLQWSRGAGPQLPITAFICCHCLLADYDNGETLLPLPKAASYDRLAMLLGLVSGRICSTSTSAVQPTPPTRLDGPT